MVCTFLLILTPALCSAIVYVGLQGEDSSSCGNNTGRLACASIAQALKVADWRSDISIAVEAGTYSPRKIGNFALKSTVNLAGIGGQVLIDCANAGIEWSIEAQSGNSYNISNFTFRNCNASEKWGIGIQPAWCNWGDCTCSLRFCSKAAGLTITNGTGGEPLHNVHVFFTGIEFIGNVGDRGAIQMVFLSNVSDSSFRFVNCTFTQNKARTIAGGSAVDMILSPSYARTDLPQSLSFMLTSVQMIFSGCLFKENDGGQGSILFWGPAGNMEGFDITFTSSNFLSNKGSVGAGVAYHPPLPCGETINTLLFDSVDFNGNTASAVGGAFLGTLPISTTVPDPPTPFMFRNWSNLIHVVNKKTRFISNRALTGGAYCISNGLHVFNDCVFNDNHATKVGGALCLGCGGGGNAALIAKNTIFTNNTASKGSTFSSSSGGSVVLSNCTFNLAGSSKGASDFELSGSGAFDADNTTSWRCEPNAHMLNPSSKTIDLVDSGILDVSWNPNNVAVKLNYMTISCLQCVQGTYNLMPTVLNGPVRSICTGIDTCAVTSTKKKGPDICRVCPFGGNCTGQNVSASSAVQGQEGFYGLVCDNDAKNCVANAVSPDQNEIRFAPCPSGLCAPSAWNSSCVDTRTGLLCTRCIEGYSEALGSSKCIPNHHCTAAWFLPIVVLLFVYAIYIYWSAPSATYSIIDMVMLYFQMQKYVFITSHELHEALGTVTNTVTSWLSLSFSMLATSNNGGSSKLHPCIWPGMTPVGRISIGYGGALALVVCICCVHVISHLVLPESWRPSARDGGDVLSLALGKGFLVAYSSVIGATASLLNCVPVPGHHRWRLFRAADLPCYTPWQYLLAVALPFLLLSSALPGLLMLSCLEQRAPKFMIRWASRIKAVEQSNGVFREKYWAMPYFLALVRGIFAIVPTIWASEATHASVNAVFILILLLLETNMKPFEDWRLRQAQATLTCLLGLLSISVFTSCIFSSFAIPEQYKKAPSLERMQFAIISAQILSFVLPFFIGGAVVLSKKIEAQQRPHEMQADLAVNEFASLN